MQGLMMDTPLLISSIATHAEKYHGGQEIVSVTADNPLHRYTYKECFGRARQLANALERLTRGFISITIIFPVSGWMAN